MIRKAIIPAAGLGTRFLPATKTVPKEMLCIVDRPNILYVVEEALKAGIEDIILVQARGKESIENFFDISYELEDRLERAGKLSTLETIRKIRDSVNLISVRQKEPLGLGHAVYCAHRVIGNNPFAVLLGDEIVLPRTNEKKLILEELMQHYEHYKGSYVGTVQVSDEDVSRYGICEYHESSDSSLSKAPKRVKRIIEKPGARETSSRSAVMGRYVFDADIFDFLRNTRPGKLGEIQLTDAMNLMLSEKPLFGVSCTNLRLDTGDRLGFIQANILCGLRYPDLRKPLELFLKDCQKGLLREENASHLSLGGK